jgi:predicted SnoaL-like aldol condensation-catalyzing enzyme
VDHLSSDGDGVQRTNEDIAREMYERLFHDGDASVLDQYVDPAFVYQNPMKPVEGRQQIVDLVMLGRLRSRDIE